MLLIKAVWATKCLLAVRQLRFEVTSFASIIINLFTLLSRCLCGLSFHLVSFEIYFHFFVMAFDVSFIILLVSFRKVKKMFWSVVFVHPNQITTIQISDAFEVFQDLIVAFWLLAGRDKTRQRREQRMEKRRAKRMQAKEDGGPKQQQQSSKVNPCCAICTGIVNEEFSALQRANGSSQAQLGGI